MGKQAASPPEATLVQLVMRKVRHDRAPRGAQPVFEMDLLPHEQIVGVEHYGTIDYRTRATVDHYASVWVAVHLDPRSET